MQIALSDKAENMPLVVWSQNERRLTPSNECYKIASLSHGRGKSYVQYFFLVTKNCCF